MIPVRGDLVTAANRPAARCPGAHDDPHHKGQEVVRPQRVAPDRQPLAEVFEPQPLSAQKHLEIRFGHLENGCSRGWSG